MDSAVGRGRDDCQGNEAREPEEHGESIEAQDDEAVRESLGEPGRQDLPGDYDDAPDGDEKQEAEGRWHAVVDKVFG